MPTRSQPIKFPEASYDAGLGDNPEYDVAKLRLGYESMVTPGTVYDYHLADQRFETLKVQEIPSGYDASQYVTERVMITARDGAKVPVSVLVQERASRRTAASRCISMPMALMVTRCRRASAPTALSMVDRGFAYAIAHIRGGDDLGYQWYLDGKLTKRTNTFNDFVDAAKGLIELGLHTGKGKVTASGGSGWRRIDGRGGQSGTRPLFGAVVSHVAFVDVLNTMLDKDLPLTPGEWPEWGNPITDKAAFDYIRSYSALRQCDRPRPTRRCSGPQASTTRA